MKQIHIRRHAPKHAEGHLTDEGKETANELKKTLGSFDIVISSDKPRAVETAKLLTGTDPVIERRAGTPPFTHEEEIELHILGEHKHPHGIAGIIFENPKFRKMIIDQGKQLVDLIHETMNELPENGKALIISHDGVMVAAEKILMNKSLEAADKGFKPLHGFVVNEDGAVEDIS